MDLVRADASFGRLSYLTESWAYNESIDPVLRENRARINSGFQATRDDLRFVPPKWTAKFFCRICAKVHDFDFAEARVCECPHKCPAYGDCKRCEFGKLAADQTAA
jgi:hypothetical protein